MKDRTLALAGIFQAAELVRQALINLGIDETRLIARGVGPLAPFCSEGNCEERVELVLIQQD